MTDVVITGTGAVTAAGVGTDQLWQALLDGRALASPGSIDPPAGMPPLAPVPIAVLDRFEPREVLGAKGIRLLTRESADFAVSATLACREAGIPERHEDAAEIATVVGTDTAGLHDYVDLFATRCDSGTHEVNPAQGPLTGPNTPAAQYSIWAGVTGPNHTVSGGSTAGLDAVDLARRLLLAGRARLSVTGATDTLSYLPLALRASDAAAGRPGAPFDQERGASIPGEAAGVVVLETTDSARRRSAPVLARIGAVHSAFDVDPAAAARRVLGEALESARVSPADVAAVICGAGGDPDLDAAEAIALSGSLARDTPVCAIAGSIGACAAASGVVQIVLAVRAGRERTIPASVGLRVFDPRLPPLAVTTRTSPLREGPILVHVLDPSGRAAAVVLT